MSDKRWQKKEADNNRDGCFGQLEFRMGVGRVGSALQFSERLQRSVSQGVSYSNLLLQRKKKGKRGEARKYISE